VGQLVAASALDVQLARAVAALAADRRAREHRRLVAADRVLDRPDAVGVAEEAADVRLAQVALQEAGGDVPLPLLGVPADRGLEDEPVADVEERVAALAGADDVVDLAVELGQGLPLPVEHLLAVPDAVAA